MYQVSNTILLVLIAIFWACSADKPESIQLAEANLPESVDFNFHIRPLLSDRCYKCHGPDGNQRKADLRLDQPQLVNAGSGAESSRVKKIINPGKLNESEIFHRIISEDPEYMMPPPESNRVLTNQEKAMIIRWIEQGAEYKPHWAFIPPSQHKVPEIQNEDWANNPIDHFILKRIESKGLKPAPEAFKETLLRRVSLDLTGLPPTVEELHNFIADHSENAYEKVVHRLLDSKHYGERMAVEWLDLARYADSHGYQDDGMRNVWPWRDWVINAFNQNMPYDQFVTWQLAGDLLPNPTKEQLLATCFNRNHPQTQEGGIIDEEYRVEYVADRTNTLGKAFLALTIECARCHDHKFDPVSQKEYYSLFAFFNNINETGYVPYNGEASPTVILPSPEAKKKLNLLNNKIESLEGQLVSENYVEDLKKWLNENSKAPGKPINLDYGLVAAFDFEKEIPIQNDDLPLQKEPPKHRGVNPGKTFGYFNLIKGKLDAKPLGDIGSRPLQTEGKIGKGLLFRGDCGIRFNEDLEFDRHQQFSVSLWVKLLRAGEFGPIFNKNNGDYESYRGWICYLNKDGTLTVQFNHSWPDNSIEIKTLEGIEVDQWTHIAMAYDGSSKASGIRIYVNGVMPPFKVLTDNLHKSLIHGAQGTNWYQLPVMLGKENQESLEDIVMDEFRVYNRQLSELEVKALHTPEQLIDPNLLYSPTPENILLLDYYLQAGNNRYFNQALEGITALRKEQNLLLTDQPAVMIMKERGEVRPTFVLKRGAYDAPQEEVSADVPAIFHPFPKDSPKNRLGLAKWLTNEENPLTARVIINRLWAMFFGRGLVNTPEDFGSQGNLPTHPELLDWMALNFMENGWNVKKFFEAGGNVSYLSAIFHSGSKNRVFRP